MARRKAETIHTKPTSNVKATKPSQGLFDYFRFGESYTSLILGMVVIIIVAILLMALVRNRDTFTNNMMTDTSSTNTSKEAEDAQNQNPNEYTVSAGDTLWSIAEKNYQSGYNWVEIAKANNLESPDAIETGIKLSIPQIEKESTIAAQEQSQPNAPNAISGTTYQVQEGDFLWNIAVRAYGDGFKWGEIAKANNIQNPDIIFTGTTLQLPR